MMLPIREPVALNFYARECSKERIEEYVLDFRVPVFPRSIVAGIVPHAGWSYSGKIAAEVFKCIKEKNPPDTFLLLGAIHSGENVNSIYSEGSWGTPLGNVAVDEETADMLLASFKGDLEDGPAAHSAEHSLEVQVPFIKYFFPQAKIVPVRVSVGRKAELFGKRIGEVIAVGKKKIIVIASTDLTHYGLNYGFAPAGTGAKAYAWMKDNDARIINLALNLKADKIVEEAAKSYNACGSGAMAAATAAAVAMGAAGGVLLDYKTSHEVSGDRDFYMGVGYAGIVFGE